MARDSSTSRRKFCNASWCGGVVSGFGFRKLALHFTIEERGFDQAKAQHAPAGGDHFGHQIFLNRGAGLISSGIITEHFLEFILIFAVKDYGLFRSKSMIERITG